MRLKALLALLLILALLAPSALAEIMPVAEDGMPIVEDIIAAATDAPIRADAEAPYYITVDIANQIVTVYKNNDRTTKGIVKQMICSTGMGDATPRGTYVMPNRSYTAERQEWFYFSQYAVYAKWASRIVGAILFHSILFKTTKSDPTYNSLHALGSKASHGCVRLRVADARWISENCLAGTTVNIFDDGERDENLRALLKEGSFSADELRYAEFLEGRVTLTRGSGLKDRVKQLQQALNALGYSCGSADGRFGAQTEKAVMAWQKANDCEETGEVTAAQMDIILEMQAAEAAKDEEAETE